jgi:hypothetical protein
MSNSRKYFTAESCPIRVSISQMIRVTISRMILGVYSMDYLCRHCYSDLDAGDVLNHLGNATRTP